MTNDKKSIECSVGILTYNSEPHLARALDSLRGFREIIIADGGSTDRTVEIAQKYGCKVIMQSNPGKPIADFSIERNLILDAATSDWFFYLDSDEVVSDELHSEIERVVSGSHPKYLVYRVRYEKTNPDLTVHYKTAKPYYQTRFFNKRSGARFIKPIHERIAFSNDVPVGLIEAPWFVPLDTQLDFKTYRKKIVYRIDIMASHATFKSTSHFVSQAFVTPLVEIVKSILKIMYLSVQGTPDRIPTRYELFRMYSQLYLMSAYTKRFLSKKSVVR